MRNLLLINILINISSVCLWAQPGTITTVAGNYSPGLGLPAAQVQLSRPVSLAVDGAGNVFLAEDASRWIRRIDGNGMVQPFAGTGAAFDAPNDQIEGRLAATTAIRQIVAIHLRPNGSLLFADNQHRILQVSTDGIIRHFAGTAGPNNRFSGDGGPAEAAEFFGPRGFAEDSQGNVYVCDSANHRIRKIDVNGIVTTVAGNGTQGSAGDGGPATDAQLSFPGSLAFHPDGSLLIADTGNRRIRKLLSDGTIVTVAGTSWGFSGDGGPAVEARFADIQSVAVSPDGRIFVADSSNKRIRVIDADGIVRTAMGGGAIHDPASGILPDQVSLAVPTEVRLAPNGSLFVVDTANQMVLVLAGGLVKRFAGVAPPVGNPSAALFGAVSTPDVSAGPDGMIYLVSSGQNRLFQVDPVGMLRHIGGSGSSAQSMDRRPALDMPLSNPSGVAIAPDGAVVVSAYSGNVVIRFAVDGTAEVIAGTGVRSSTGDGGPATQATLSAPSALVYDRDGNLFIAEAHGNRVRKVTPDGVITAVAGSGAAGFAGDNGPADKAMLNFPFGLAIDRQGHLLIADSANQRIRRVDTSGTITTIAGTGVFGFAGDGGRATQARLGSPRGIAVDADGNILIADRNNHRIRRIDRNGIITTVAGNGEPRFAGDGQPAIRASLHSPQSVSFDSQGNLLISDWGNHRIRRIQGFAGLAVAPAALQFEFALNAPAATRTATVTSADSTPRRFSLASDAPWLRAEATANEATLDAPATITVTANPAGLTKGRYLARVLLTDIATGDQYRLPVTITVSGTPQQLRLGQTGYTFVALQGAPTTFQQTLAVLNVGTGSMAWTAAASTLQPGSWLSITGNGGQSTPAAPAAPIRIAVNPAGLSPGVYYGLVTVTAPQADNAPQSAVIILNVLPSSTPPGPQLDTSGVLFTLQPGTPLAPRNIQLLNLSGAAANYTTSISYPDSRRWLTVTPTSGQLAAGAGVSLALSANPTGLPAGVYRATLNVQIQPGNQTRSATVQLVVPPATGAAAARQATAECQPKALVPVFRAPGAGFFTNAGWPANVEIEVASDCGQPVTAGRATVTFSTGEPPLVLTHAGQGRWAGTWISRATNQTSTRLTLRMEIDAPRLAAQAELTIGIRQNTTQPIIERSGIRSLATMLADEPLPTGSLAVVLGSGLAANAAQAPELPLPVALNGTRVLLAGRSLPLRQVAEGRVEAFVPQGLPEFTPLQLIVQRGTAYSVPAPVILVGNAPAIFSVDGTGRNQGLIYAAADSTRLADYTRPVRPGDDIVLFASGIGPIDRAPDPGAAAPADPPLAVQVPLTLTIEGKDAPIKEAILAPGLVGVYRLTATVPADAEPSANARVVLSVNDIPSPAVTMAIQAREGSN